MRRVFPITIVILFVSAFVCWRMTNRTAPLHDSTGKGPVSSFGTVPTTAAPAMDEPSEQHANAPANNELPSPPSQARNTEQRAFRFVLSFGKLELETVEDIRGDFHPRRGRTAWQPGMLYCRLLDDQQRVLAEETVPAPDHVCVVLDPNTPGPDGKPQPAVLTTTGPVVFQVRLPKMDSATQMKVYRLAGAQSAGLDEEPPGQLLAIIPLAR